MRASSAITPAASASSGLMSSSSISAMSITSCEILTSVAAMRVEVGRRPVAIALEQPTRRGCAPSARGRACRLSGGSASARSSMTSTAVPPWPNSSTGPNCRIGGHADDQLVRAAGGATICCTLEAVELRLRRGAARCARAWRLRPASHLCGRRPDRARRRRRRTCAGCPARGSSAPPGQPISAASAAASCGLRGQRGSARPGCRRRRGPPCPPPRSASSAPRPAPRR